MFNGRHRGAASIALRSYFRSAQRVVLGFGLLLVSCASLLPAQSTGRTSVVRLPVVEGKDLRFTHLSTEKGLSQSVVDNILQDNQGFMWFGTQDGLDRYDGYEFRTYKHDTSNSGLSGPAVLAIFKDRLGTLWIGGDQFLDRLDPVTQKITHYRSDPKNPNSLSGSVYGIAQSSDGQMWLGTSNGLDRLNPATGTFAHYRHDPNDPDSLDSNGSTPDIRFIGFDRSGTLWVETSAGINSFDEKTEKAHRYPQLRNRAEHHVQKVYQDSLGTLWIHSYEGTGLGTFDSKTGAFVQYVFQTPGSDRPTTERVTSILEDRNGTLWFGTEGSGLMKWDRRRGAVVRYRNDPADGESLSNNLVKSLYEDQEGNIWVGTGGGGVSRVSETPSGFVAYRKKPGHWNSLDQSFVLSVFEDSHGTLWIGNDGVLNSVDRETGRFAFHRNSVDPTTISDGTVLSAVEDRSGTLWLGSYRGGLNSFDRRTGHFKAYRHIPDNPNSPSSDVIIRLLLDSGDALWIGTDHGLDRFDFKSNRFDHFSMLADKIAGTRLSSLVKDHHGTLWLGTLEGGLHRFNPTTGEHRAYVNNPGIPGTLSSNRVNALFVDKTGGLWVGTQYGLNKLDAGTNKFLVYGEQDGLSNDTIQGILEDRKGNLWVSTNNGLVKFNPATKAVRNYYASDGLAGSEFTSWGTPFESSSGEMFFPGVKGVTAFFPERVIENSYVPPVVLTDFRLFGVSMPVGGHSPLQRSISYTNSLVLNHTQHIFSFQFSALSYADAERNRYRYMLEGLEGRWNEVSSMRRFVTYTTLAPGEYRFRVQGSNNRGVWNESGVTLSIRILPPWWHTWWFRVIAVLGSLALVWSLYGLRVRSIERRNRELTKLYSDLQRSQNELQSQTRILQSILDSMGDGVTVVDERGEFLLVNPAAEEIVGVPDGDSDPGQWPEGHGFYLPDQATLYPSGDLPLARAIRGEPSNSVEIFARNPAHPQGMWLSVTARPLKDKIGNIRGAVAVFSNVTAHKRAEIELRQAQKMEAIGRLAGGIAHDFNNVLSVIIGQSGLVLSQTGIDGSIKRRIQEILDAGTSAASLTRQLLVFSRKQLLQPSVVNLNDVVANVESMIRRLMGDDIEVRTWLAPDLENVNADPSQMEQVLINLCVNARDAMARGGRIAIETKNSHTDELVAAQHSGIRPGRYVRLVVSDTGSGIDKDILPHIFEPFFTTKGPTEGTGLGLATVYGIVKQSGGDVFAYSEAGQGSTFSVYLPAVEKPKVREHTPVPQEAMQGSETILLVEDSAPLRAVVRETLERLGYKILEAEDAQRADQIARQYDGEIDLLLTDLSLPKGSGQGVAKSVQAKRSSIRVLYMSANPRKAVHSDVQEPGTDFLQKPFTQEALAQKLRAIFNHAD